MSTLPSVYIPEFYSAAACHSLGYRPNLQKIANCVERRRRTEGSLQGSSRPNIQLLLIDLQRDFCHVEGSLHVGGGSGEGAERDNDRTARLIYAVAGHINGISCTLDTHHPQQIFFPAFWQDERGLPPPPYTIIEPRDISEGRFKPREGLAEALSLPSQKWLTAYVDYYLNSLLAHGRQSLCIWPYHCLQGSLGHALAGVIEEAVLFHELYTGKPRQLVIKGQQALTEHYSVFSPEVSSTHDGRLIVEPNRELLRRLRQADAILIAGQAASHCVNHSIEDLLSALGEYACPSGRAKEKHCLGEASNLSQTDHQTPSLKGGGKQDKPSASKIYILRDCMSSVVVRDPQQPKKLIADFRPQTEQVLQRFAKAGAQVTSSDKVLSSLFGIG